MGRPPPPRGLLPPEALYVVRLLDLAKRFYFRRVELTLSFAFQCNEILHADTPFRFETGQLANVCNSLALGQLVASLMCLLLAERGASCLVFNGALLVVLSRG